MSKSAFFENSFISVDQIRTRKQLLELFAVADMMKEVVENHQVYEPLSGMSVAILFYQPSTRTFTSFEAASRRLGASVVAIHGMEQYSSVSKGETLTDTIRSVYQTTGADLIVLRHPDNESSQVADGVSSVPIINAGSGIKEHPTQALLDLYTIYKRCGTIDNLRIAFVGDLKYGRTIKSLAKLLTKTAENTRLIFVSPDELRAPAEFIVDLKKRGSDVVESDTLTAHLPNIDVCYMTRVQKEWFVAEDKLSEYERIKDTFILSNDMVETMPQSAVVLHPLPRVGEIKDEVDANPRAAYFEQMRSGLYVRMALIQLILKGH